MEFIGFLASVLIGVSLGLIGSGGSILTVPVLVYLFGVDTVAATGYSLFIVGLTALVGAIDFYRKNLVNVRTAIVFGIPSILAVFVTRAYIVPAIPKQVMQIGDLVITKSLLLLLLFAILMVFSAVKMIIPSKKTEEVRTKEQHFNYPLIFIEGLVVGLVTGLVGAGGGFLIIPALVLLSGLPMKQAVGTSLTIIAAKSLLGFLGEKPESAIDWMLLTNVSLFAIIGIYIGGALSKRIEGRKLKPAFGWFVLIMGIYIIIKELMF